MKKSNAISAKDCRNINKTVIIIVSNNFALIRITIMSRSIKIVVIKEKDRVDK